MAIKVNLSDCQFEGDETIILDTNILLYLFGPFNGENDYGYSSFLEEAIRKRCTLVVTDVILSEFINRNLRLAHKQYVKSNGLKSKTFQYKRDYRKTDDFVENYELSLDIVRTEILRVAKLFEISTEDMGNSVSMNYRMLDYNDEVILRAAERTGFGIITHDRDFFNQDSQVTIFSKNG